MRSDRRRNQYNTQFEPYEWDQVERRTGADRRVAVEYVTPTSTVFEEKKWYNGPAITIIFSSVMAIAGFIFALNTRVSTLEFRTTEFEKFETEVKSQFLEIKQLAKEHEQSHSNLKSQLSSIELSLFETLRTKKNP
jgi:hypothetical protein